MDSELFYLLSFNRKDNYFAKYFCCAAFIERMKLKREKY